MAYYIGDSIAEGYKNAAKANGDTQVGRSPAAVLDAINKGPDLTGQKVVLSTGLSNNPNDLNSVGLQFAALKNKGVNPSDIQVLGVGSKFNNYNPVLGGIAQQNGAQFGGGFEAGADGVHPKSYATMVAPSSVPAPATVKAETDNPTPFDTRTELFKGLTQRGLTSQQAMGVIYSTMGESGTALDPNSKGDSGKSFGFGQWNGQRFTNLQSTAAGMNTTWNDPKAQVAHFFNEVDGPYSKELANVKANASTAADATNLWTGSASSGSGFERPATNNWQQRYVQGSQAGRLDDQGNPIWKTGPAAPLPSVGSVPNQGPTQPGVTPTPAPPPTSGAQDFQAAAQKGDVGGALAALTKGTDTSKGGALGDLNQQVNKAAPAPAPSQMLQAPSNDRGGEAQAGQALLSQVLQQSGKPLSWSSAPFGSGQAGQSVPGVTLNNSAYPAGTMFTPAGVI